MITVFLAIIGLCLGSFVNALVWRLRLHRQHSGADDQAAPEKASIVNSPGRLAKEAVVGVAQEIWEWLRWPVALLLPKKKRLRNRSKKPLADKYSIAKGRSMCPRCEHELSALDLVPVFSWLWLRGKCRYCHKRISWQYPLVELMVANAFVLSYVWWPNQLTGYEVARFVFWLMLVVGFAALAVYDARWKYLPNELLYPLLWLAVLMTACNVVFIGPQTLLAPAYGVLIIWGLFFAIFCAGEAISRQWIGYGDVRLAVLLGLVVGGPWSALFTVFLASLLGTLIAIPLLVGKRADRSTELPYGPFLLLAAVIVMLGSNLFLEWLDRLLLL